MTPRRQWLTAGGFNLKIGEKMFFRRTRNIEPKPPIVIADQMVMNAMIIAYGYFYNIRYMPTQEDLKMFDEFVDELQASHAIASRIAHNLHQRIKNESK